MSQNEGTAKFLQTHENAVVFWKRNLLFAAGSKLIVVALKCPKRQLQLDQAPFDRKTMRVPSAVLTNFLLMRHGVGGKHRRLLTKGLFHCRTWLDVIVFFEKKI